MELPKNNDDSTPKGVNDVMLSKDTLSSQAAVYKTSKLTAHLLRKAKISQTQREN